MEKLRASFRAANFAVKIAIDDGQIQFPAIFHFPVHASNFFGHGVGVNGQHRPDFAALQATFDDGLTFEPTKLARITIGIILRFNRHNNSLPFCFFVAFYYMRQKIRIFYYGRILYAFIVIQSQPSLSFKVFPSPVILNEVKNLAFSTS